MIHYLTLALAILSGLTAITAGVSSFFRKKGDETHAAQLDTAHEALHVLVQALDEHEHGEAVITALLDAAKSPEAQDLFQKVLRKVRS